MFAVGERTSREERRRIQRTQAYLCGVGVIVALMAAGAVLALLFLSLFGHGRATADELPKETPYTTAAVVDAALLLPVNQDLWEPVSLPPEIIQQEAEEIGSGKLLESVPLDPELQDAIFSICGGDGQLFCFVMAIAKNESSFQVRAVNGYCYGMMQINTRWHMGRAERLGVSDLMDPAQSVIVAADYLRELDELYGWPLYSHQILMAYNMGPGAAQKAFDNGKSWTQYSAAVMETWADYCVELEG